MPYKRNPIPPGFRVGKLEVICRDTGRVDPRNAYYLCRCDCGGGASVRADYLRFGLRASCGNCFPPRVMPKSTAPKGAALGSRYPREHSSWKAMLWRCDNPKSVRYHRYGGRGIKVCERWREFQNFVADMAPRPEGMCLDRIDNDGDYTPENCRWSTMKEQVRNTSRVRTVKINGVSYRCIAEAADSLGVNYDTLRSRINRGSVT